MSLDPSKINLKDPLIRDLRVRKEEELSRLLGSASGSAPAVSALSRELLVEVVGEYLQKSRDKLPIDDADLSRYYGERLLERCGNDGQLGALMPIIRSYVLAVISWLDRIGARGEIPGNKINQSQMEEIIVQKRLNIGISSLMIKLGRSKIFTDEQLKIFYQRVSSISREEGKKALTERYRQRSREYGWRDTFSYPEGGIRKVAFTLIKSYLERVFPNEEFLEVQIRSKGKIKGE